MSPQNPNQKAQAAAAKTAAEALESLQSAAAYFPTHTPITRAHRDTFNRALSTKLAKIAPSAINHVFIGRVQQTVEKLPARLRFRTFRTLRRVNFRLQHEDNGAYLENYQILCDLIRRCASPDELRRFMFKEGL